MKIRGWKPQVSTLLCPCRVGKFRSLRKRQTPIPNRLSKEKPAAHAAGFNFTKCRECYSLFSASRRALFAAITFSCTGTGASS